MLKPHTALASASRVHVKNVINENDNEGEGEAAGKAQRSGKYKKVSRTDADEHGARVAQSAVLNLPISCAPPRTTKEGSCSTWW